MSAKGINTAEELDARVGALLREMDAAHARVTKRLDWPPSEDDADLDRNLNAALKQTAELAAGAPAVAEGSVDALAAGAAPAPPTAPAAGSGGGSSAEVAPAGGGAVEVPTEAGSEAGEGASEAVKGAEQTAGGGAWAGGVGGVSAGDAPAEKPPSAEAASATAPVQEPAVHGEHVVGLEARTIEDLDAQLSKALASTVSDDEFIDGKDVPPTGEVPVAVPVKIDVDKKLEPAVVAVEAAAVPVAKGVAPAVVAAVAMGVGQGPVGQKAPAAVPGGAPVVERVPVGAGAPSAAVQVSAAVAPAAGAAGVKEVAGGWTLADRFWDVVTPLIEPIALRLGRIPAKTQQTFAWIGVTTSFVASITLVYVFFFINPRPRTHAPEVPGQEQTQGSAQGQGKGESQQGVHAPAAGDGQAKGGH